MDYMEYDTFLISQICILGNKLKKYQEKYERTDYLYCIDNGLVYDEDEHKRYGYNVETYKDLYVSDLERFLRFYCEHNDIDLDDLKLHYGLEDKKND